MENDGLLIQQTQGYLPGRETSREIQEARQEGLNGDSLEITVSSDQTDPLVAINRSVLTSLSTVSTNYKKRILDQLDQLKLLSDAEKEESNANARQVYNIYSTFLNEPRLESVDSILSSVNVNSAPETSLSFEQVKTELTEFLNLLSGTFRVNPEVYLKDFPGVLDSFFYDQIKPNLKTVSNESLAPSLPLVSANNQPRKSQNSLVAAVTIAVTALLAGITGASVNNEGADKNQRPLASSLTTEDIPRVLHQPEPSVKLSLNEESNTFQDLEKYFSQNPNEDSQWSAVYNLIKMSGIQEYLGNKPISIVDFEKSVPDKFPLGGVQYDLKRYLEEIQKENVYPPCAHVKSCDRIMFNEPVVDYARNNPSSIETASLVDVFGGPQNGRALVLDECQRNLIFPQFEKKPLTTNDYRNIRRITVPQRMAGNLPLRQISSPSKKEN